MKAHKVLSERLKKVFNVKYFKRGGKSEKGPTYEDYVRMEQEDKRRIYENHFGRH